MANQNAQTAIDERGHALTALASEAEARGKEEGAHKLAAANAEQTRQMVARLGFLANGTRLVDQGDSLLAMPWFADAAQFDAGNSRRQVEHNLRLTTAWRSKPQALASLVSPAGSYLRRAKQGRTTSGHRQFS